MDDALDLLLPSPHGVQLVGARERGQVHAELVQDGGPRAATAGAGLAGGNALAQEPLRLSPHLVQRHAQALQNACGYALAFTKKADEEMLGADVVVAHPPGFVNRELNDLLRPRGQANVLARDRPLAAPDDELNGGPNLGQVYPQVSQNARGDPFRFSHQPQ